MAIANFAVGFKGDGKTRVIASDSNSLDITGDLTVEAGVFPIATSHSVVIANKDNPWECALQSNILKAAIKTAQWDWHGGGEVPLKKWTFSLSPSVKRSIIHLTTVSMRIQEQTRARSSLLMSPFSCRLATVLQQ